MNRTSFIAFTALMLGLGWAIRGHFGHEWGAAWAGAMGTLALVWVSGRKDWWQRAPVLAALGGMGWAVGGMMSYGIVIGYCRGTDFWNVAYGYAMLAVIGGLYGCVGGGFLGLGLEDGQCRRPQWASLLAEMVAGAYLFWGFLVYQLELLMTPPRSELWAACLGAALALVWHLHRHGFHAALRVALWTTLGAGVGFSLGNFIQTLGHASGLSYNWWNVMEFTLGALGGGALAWAIGTDHWPKLSTPSKAGNLGAWLFVFGFLPLINLYAAFTPGKLERLAERVQASSPEATVLQHQWAGVGLILLFGAAAWWSWQQVQTEPTRAWTGRLFLLLALLYTLFSYLLKGIFLQPLSLGESMTLYLPLLILAFLYAWFRKEGSIPWESQPVRAFSWRTYGWAWLAALGLIVIQALISIHAHGGIKGFHERF